MWECLKFWELILMINFGKAILLLWSSKINTLMRVIIRLSLKKKELLNSFFSNDCSLNKCKMFCLGIWGKLDRWILLFLLIKSNYGVILPEFIKCVFMLYLMSSSKPSGLFSIFFIWQTRKLKWRGIKGLCRTC